MKKTLFAVLSLLTLLTTSSARADEPPPNGTGFIGAGVLLTATGTGTALSGIRCWTMSDHSQRTGCIAGSFGLGGVMLAAGIPLVVVGAQRRAVWLEWTKRGGVTPVAGGAMATWAGTW